MEKARGELNLPCIDTGLKLGILLWPYLLHSKLNPIDLISNDDYVIQSRYLVSQCDTFSLLNLTSTHGATAQISHLPLAYASKKNTINNAAIKYRPLFFKNLEKCFGSDVGIYAAKSIVKMTGSCNMFVKLPNVSNVVFYSPLFGILIDKIASECELIHGSKWKEKFPDTFKLLKEFQVARNNV